MWHIRNLPEQSNALLPDGQEHVASVLANAQWHIFPNVIPRVVVISNSHVHGFSCGTFISWQPKKLIWSVPLGQPLHAERCKLWFKLELGGEIITVPLFHKEALAEVISASEQCVDA